MFNLDELKTFSNSYFKHPYLRELGLDNCFLRVVTTTSAPLRLKYPDKFKDKWFLEQRVIPASVLLEADRDSADIAWLCGMNTKGCNIYYYPNVTHKDMKGVATDKQVLAYLYWCLDYDYPLGVGIDKLLADSGLDASMIVMTSSYVLPKTQQNYQVLIPVGGSGGFGGIGSMGTEDCREVKLCAGVGKWLSEMWLSDGAVMNPATLLRLPGFTNWKVRGNNRANTGGIVSVHYCADSPTAHAGYTCEQIVGIENKHRELLHKAYVLDGKTGAKAASTVKAGGSLPMIIEQGQRSYAVGYKEALAMLPERVAGEGERHRALISWAGELANEVSGSNSSSNLDKEAARALICKLGEQCCSPPADVGDIRKADKWFLEVLGRDLDKKERKMSELLGELPTEVPSIVVDTSFTNGSTNGGLADPLLPSTTPPASTSSGAGTNVAVTEIVGQWVNEVIGSVDTPWLVDFVLAMYELNIADGMSYKASKLVINKIDAAGFLPGPWVCHLRTEWGVWGSEYKHLCGSSRDQLTVLIGAVIEKLCMLVKQRAGEIGAHRAFKGLRAEISDRICVAMGVEKGSEKWTKAMEKEIALALDLRLSRGKKASIVGDCIRIGAGFKLEEDVEVVASKVVFQNGILDVESGEFVECDGYRLSTRALAINYDVNYAPELPIVVNLELELPLFSGFLRDCFPDDPMTWELVLAMIGYMFVGDNPLQKIFTFTGISGSGKSTLAKIICGIAGGHNVATMRPDVVGRESEGISSCIGKLVGLIEEAETGDAKVHQNMFVCLKEVTNGYKMRVRNIYDSAFESVIHSKFLLVSNLPLKYEDTLGAGARRMVPLAFDNPVMNSKANSRLTADILSNEAEKIGNIAVRVLVKHWHLGLGLFDEINWPSKALTEGRLEVAQNTDPLGYALGEVVEIDPESTSDYAIPISLLKYICSVVSSEYNDNARWLSKNVYGSLKRRGLVDTDFGKNNKKKIAGKQIYLLNRCRINVAKLEEVSGLSFENIMVEACQESPELVGYFNAVEARLWCCQITKKALNAVLQLISQE